VKDGVGSTAGGARLETVDASHDDVLAVATELARVALGAAALSADVALRALGRPAPHRGTHPEQAGWAAADAVDSALGLSWLAVRMTNATVGYAARGAVAVTERLAPTRRLVRPGARPMRLLGAPARRWRAERAGAIDALARWSTAVAPAAGNALTTLVDVNALIADAMRSIRIQQVAELMVSQLDLDALAEAIVDRLDVGRVVDDVVARQDMTDLVQRSIRTMDLESIATTVLSQMHIADLVIKHVDMDKVVEGAFDSVDMTQLILDRIDLVRITEYVVEANDIPAMVRDSTMTLTSETVREVRRQSADADQAVARFVSRFLGRGPAPA
jgi:hypothetical protein